MKRKSFFAVFAACVMAASAAGCEKDQEIKSYGVESEAASLAEERGWIEEESLGSAEQTEEKREICVYICGAVKKPGVVNLPPGARVFEAIEKAGGLRGEAAKEAVNQAAQLEDGQQIVIPTKEEAEAMAAEGGASQTAERGEEKVNINRAAQEELMSLPGIGAAKAAGIIEYREMTGSFQSIEEIKNVSGIGDAVFEKIKDRIGI